MIPPFFPWFLAFLLLIACVALLVLLLRYRDRSVRLEAESRSWQERAEDRTQMLRRAEEVLKDSFAGISAEVLRNSEKQFLNLAETRLQSQRQQANHDLDSRKQAIESMLKPVSESLKLVQSRLGEMEKERVGAYTDLKTQIRYILSGNEALKMKPPGFPRLCTTTAFAANGESSSCAAWWNWREWWSTAISRLRKPVPGRRNGYGRTWSFTFLEAVPSLLTRKRPWHPT